MFRFLDRYFTRELINITGFVILLFFPLIFLADFAITGNFDFFVACSKILFRYGQMFPLILLVASYLTTVNILYRHPKEIFLQLNCNELVFIRTWCFSGLLAIFVYFVVLVPSNRYCFNDKLHATKWFTCQKNSEVRFIYRLHDDKYLVYTYNKETGEIEKTVEDNIKVGEQDFYVTWNDAKKLSYSSLIEYRKYLKRHNWSTEDVDKQICIYIYQFVLLFLMLLCGYTFALKKANGSMFLIFFSSTWINILAFYLTLKYCILVLCLNLIVWSGVVFVRLFF